jgi:hypothetical protein
VNEHERALDAHCGLKESLSIDLAGPGAIEAQEQRGQQKLVAGVFFPVRFVLGDPSDADAALARWGWTLGAPLADDPLFRRVEMPPGWRKVATDHAMHSDVLDERDRKRVHVFYKAAFYDRDAFFGLIARFDVEEDYAEGEYRDRVELRPPEWTNQRVIDRATGEVLFVADVPPEEAVAARMASYMNQSDPAFILAYERRALMQEACREWIAARYPDRSPGAYWEPTAEATAAGVP